MEHLNPFKVFIQDRISRAFGQRCAFVRKPCYDRFFEILLRLVFLYWDKKAKIPNPRGWNDLISGIGDRKRCYDPAGVPSQSRRYIPDIFLPPCHTPEAALENDRRYLRHFEILYPAG